MQTISISAPRLVRIGENSSAHLPEILGLLGACRPLLVIDSHFRNSEVVGRLCAALETEGRIPGSFYGVVPDPTTASVKEGVSAAKAHRADSIVAIGGGSALDSAKAIALLVVKNAELRSFRAPYRVAETGLPLVAIPTTAGTGSEATRFCLVSDSETGDKMVCIGEGFVPAAALVDFALTLSVPSRVTAETGIDAFTHALEAYVGQKANIVSDLYAEKALVLIAKALPALIDDLANKQARADMMLGSYLAGSAFSNSGLALAHAMSAPLGATFHIPHGLSIGMLLPEVTRFSVTKAPERYGRVARLLGISGTADDRKAALALAGWLEDLVARLSLRKLSDFGVEEGVYEGLVDAMATEAPRSGAAANNPAVPSHADMVGLFRAIWA